MNTLEPIDNNPGWGNARAFLQAEIVARGAKRIADVGGGANPVLDAGFVRANGLDYAVLDISQAELDKAPDYCRKITVDLTAPRAEFLAKIGDARFDLVFSCMFLEHLSAPMLAHGNIFSALAPGGVAIHMYPSPNNLPLTLNRVMPDWATDLLIRISQPKRDLSGQQRKFPAYYKMCGNASRRLHGRFEGLGYTVARHTSYIGHWYYDRFPLLREIERACRKPLVRARLGLTSAHLLILQK
ncbi:MAG: methyltransferase domain-containing protein [Steroidobacteraceae bacterium]